MADIYLSDEGTASNVDDYRDTQFGTTVFHYDSDDLGREQDIRPLEGDEIGPTYLGDSAWLALAGELPRTLVRSIDSITIDTDDSLLDILTPFRKTEAGVLRKTTVDDFWNEGYRRKYEQEYGAHVALSPHEDPRVSRPDDSETSLYSLESLVVVANESRLDDSFHLVDRVRREVVSDLQGYVDERLEEELEIPDEEWEEELAEDVEEELEEEE